MQFSGVPVKLSEHFLSCQQVIQQKLKEEEEHTYNNVRNSNVYANVGRQAVEEESIYANTNGQSQPATTHIYDNQAFGRLIL